MLRYYQHPYQYSRIAGVDAGECDAPVKITWPSEVNTFKARINTVAEAMDVGVKTCPQLPQNERQAWEGFITEWREFAKRKTGWFGSYGDWVQTCTYSKTIDAWRTKLLQYCRLPGPNEIEKPDAINIVKWVTVGAVVLGSVVLLTVYAPEIKSIFKFGKK